MSNYTDLPPGWENNILSGLGAPQTKLNQQFLDVWTSGEKPPPGQPDKFNYNPFNTELPYGNSYAPPQTPGYTVQAYPDWTTGLAATLQTLKGYPTITNDLVNQASANTFETDVVNSPWNTKDILGIDPTQYTPSSNAGWGGNWWDGITGFPGAVGSTVGGVAGAVGSGVGKYFQNTGTELNNQLNDPLDTFLKDMGLPTTADIGVSLKKWGLIILFAIAILLLVLELFKNAPEDNNES